MRCAIVHYHELALKGLRPLIGMDKLEITNHAQHIESLPIFIQPDQGCCSLFTPQHPSTKTKVTEIRKIERLFDMSALVAQGLEKDELSESTLL